MRKTYLSLPLFLMILISMSACTKSAGGNGNASKDFYLRFKADGVQNEYRAHVEGNFNKPSGPTEYITILGGTKVQFEAKKSNMTLGLTTVGTTMLHTTYTNYSASAPGLKKAKLALISFLDENGKPYASWGEEFSLVLPPGSPIDVRLVITEASSTHIRGNFSGTLYSADFSAKIKITDGEFYLEQH
ncbi:MAG: hypothetical protein H7122_03965 [Chitinophagaceae bacterium]|nr:hypothetical protein [Chitinophagaceae bacterium]